VDGRNADALGLEPAAAAGPAVVKPQTREEVEQQVWAALKTCYDPEIPVNIVDLGLVYDCQVTPVPDTGTYKVDVKMTLTAPGCGMGPVIQQDAQHKILALENVDEVNVELVWDPPWNQAMMTEAARLELGLM
jgi:probable FeS assembly SUF system protein SufT